MVPVIDILNIIKDFAWDSSDWKFGLFLLLIGLVPIYIGDRVWHGGELAAPLIPWMILLTPYIRIDVLLQWSTCWNVLLLMPVNVEQQHIWLFLGQFGMLIITCLDSMDFIPLFNWFKNGYAYVAHCTATSIDDKFVRLILSLKALKQGFSCCRPRSNYIYWCWSARERWKFRISHARKPVSAQNGERRALCISWSAFYNHEGRGTLRTHCHRSTESLLDRACSELELKNS